MEGKRVVEYCRRALVLILLSYQESLVGRSNVDWEQ